MRGEHAVLAAMLAAMFLSCQSSSTTHIPPQFDTHTPQSPQITVTSSQHLCQQHAETLLKQARYTRCFGITKSLKGIYSEAQPAAAQMAPRGPGAAAAPQPGAAAAHISVVKTGKSFFKACDHGSDGPCGRTFRVQRHAHVLYHSTAKTNAGWWSATYWFSISSQSHGNAQEAQENKNMQMNQVQSVPCFCPIKELYLSHHQANDLLNLFHLFTKTPGAWQSDSVLDLDPGADISVRPG